MRQFCTALALSLVTLAASTALAGAQQRVGTDTGLPLPRFVSLKSGQVNMRVGPGRDYKVTWQFTRAGTPVEIIAEFDNWRRIRDDEGVEGWVYGALLTGRRTGVVAPWLRQASDPSSDQFPTVILRAKPETGARRVAKLEAGVIGGLSECDGKWCRMTPDAANGETSGWVRQLDVWGVYPDETFAD